MPGNGWQRIAPLLAGGPPSIWTRFFTEVCRTSRCQGTVMKIAYRRPHKAPEN
jgi:hypothetical protein